MKMVSLYPAIGRIFLGKSYILLYIVFFDNEMMRDRFVRMQGHHSFATHPDF